MAGCHGLSENRKIFCQEYVANNYVGKTAYMKAYPNAKPKSAQVEASRLLKRQDIKDYISEIQKERFEALNITAERIGEELAKMAFADFDENNSATTKQKALELLGKQIGLYTTKLEADVQQRQDINIVIDDGCEQE